MNNNLCTEHEWAGWMPSVPVNSEAIMKCKKCGTVYMPHSLTSDQLKDFKIPENITQIEDNNWDGIIKDFYYFANRYGVGQQFKDFTKWLKENYLSPEKK